MTDLPASRPPVRRNRTRGALVQAGLSLFAERSLDAVSIDEIVQRAGVAKGSFYNHFKDRDDFAFALLVMLRGNLTAQITAINEHVTDPVVRLARGMISYIRFAIQEPESAATVLHLHRTSWDDTVDIGLHEDIRAGVAAGRLNIPTTRSGVLFAKGVGNATFAFALEANRDLVLPICQQLTAQLLRGLGVEGSEASQISAQAVDEILGAADEVPQGVSGSV